MEEISKPIQDLGISWNERWVTLMYQKIDQWMNWELLLQGVGLGVALCVGLLVSRTIGRWTQGVRVQRKKPLSFWASMGMIGAERLLPPVSALLVLVIYTAVAGAFGLAFGAVDGAISLLVAWIFLRSITGFIRSDTISRFVSLVIWIIAALNMVGLLDETTKAMEAMSFTLGNTKISMLTITRAAITLGVMLWIATLLVRIGEKVVAKSSKSMASATQELLVKILKIVFFSVAVLIGLQMAGIDLTAFAVVLGALGVGIGFGLQKITSNFISGIILLFERTISRNDLVDIGGTMGWVRYIGIRHTMLETFDGHEVLIPNEDFITQKVVNWTYTNAKSRIQFSIGVAYDSDLEKVRELILEEVGKHPRCIKDPEPSCVVRTFGDSAVTFLINFWVANVRDGLYGPQSDVMIALHKRFKKEGIEIPFPVRRMLVEEKAVEPETTVDVEPRKKRTRRVLAE